MSTSIIGPWAIALTLINRRGSSGGAASRAAADRRAHRRSAWQGRCLGPDVAGHGREDARHGTGHARHSSWISGRATAAWSSPPRNAALARSASNTTPTSWSSRASALARPASPTRRPSSRATCSRPTSRRRRFSRSFCCPRISIGSGTSSWRCRRAHASCSTRSAFPGGSPMPASCSSEIATSWCTSLLHIVPARVAGVWQLPSGELTLAQQFQMVSGTLSSGGTTAPLANGRIRGDRITFSVAGVDTRGASAAIASKEPRAREAIRGRGRQPADREADRDAGRIEAGPSLGRIARVGPPPHGGSRTDERASAEAPTLGEHHDVEEASRARHRADACAHGAGRRAGGRAGLDAVARGEPRRRDLVVPRAVGMAGEPQTALEGRGRHGLRHAAPPWRSSVPLQPPG